MKTRDSHREGRFADPQHQRAPSLSRGGIPSVSVLEQRSILVEDHFSFVEHSMSRRLVGVMLTLLAVAGIAVTWIGSLQSVEALTSGLNGYRNTLQQALDVSVVIVNTSTELEVTLDQVRSATGLPQ